MNKEHKCGFLQQYYKNWELKPSEELRREYFVFSCYCLVFFLDLVVIYLILCEMYVKGEIFSNIY